MANQHSSASLRSNTDIVDGEEEKEPPSNSHGHSKSYVNLLEDVCHGLKLTPTFQLISMEGMSHEPTFVYRVQVEGHEAAVGRGRRKQDARQLAAKNLLHLMGHPGFSDISQSQDDQKAAEPDGAEIPSTSHHVTNLAVSFADAIILHGEPSGRPADQDNTTSATIKYPLPVCRVENPVGSLQELTLSIRWPPPRFDLCLREGAAHDATFTVACYVWSYKSTGKGKSKKLAKRHAAQNMFDLLRDSPEVAELWQKRCEAYAAKTNHQRRKTAVNLPQRAPPMYQVHKDLYTSSSPTLQALRDMTQEGLVGGQLSNPLGFLQELATELSFDILFEDLYNLSKPIKPSKSRVTDPATSTTSSCHSASTPIPPAIADKSATAASLLILTVPRQIVCFGSGVSKATARQAAVKNALLYLQTAATVPPPAANL